MPFDLAESFLVAAESEIGARFPDSYRSAILRSNGGELDVDDESWQQYPISDSSDRKRLSRSANHILKETSGCLTWHSFPREAVAIAGNGSGDQLVFIKHNGALEPTVYRWLHESGSLKKVANDFSEMSAL